MTQPVFPVPMNVINPALGSDLSGIFDLTAQMGESSGRQCLAEGLARRLITPRGTLIYDPNYGYDLTGYTNDDITPANIAQMKTGITQEFLKDQRVLAATVTVQFVGPSQVSAAQAATVASPNPVPLGVIIVTATITDGTGPFTLVISVNSVTATILAVGQ